ncbi:hypothetical protein Tco_1106801 [Tanacetum coccineum]
MEAVAKIVSPMVGTGENVRNEKDAAYHKEKMLLCKQEKLGSVNATRADWKDDTETDAEHESKVDKGKALDTDLVDTESIRTDSTVQDESSRQQHTEQPKIIVEGRVDQYPETCQVKSPMLDSSPDNQDKLKYSKLIESENICSKEDGCQFQKDFSRMEAHYSEQKHSLLANNAELKAQIQEKVFAIAALKNDLRKLKGNSVDTKFDKTSVLWETGVGYLH